MSDNPDYANTPTALDLFAGAGGLSCGFEWAGGKILGAVEFDEDAAATFALNHPDAHTWVDDIRNLDISEVIETVGRPDYIIGGPMCQGVSQRGTRDPHDERNFAFWTFADYVRKIEPDFFVMENVPALASDVHNRQLAIAVFEELESMGYDIAAEVVNSSWFGLPQLRYRLIVIGSKHGRASFPSTVRRGVADDIHWTEFTTVGDAIMDLPPIEAGEELDDVPLPGLPADASEFLRTVRGDADRLYNHLTTNTAPVNLNRIEHVPEGGNWHDIPMDLLPDRFQSVRPSDHTTTYRRLDRDHPAYTITTECGNVTSGAFTHPTQNRAISVREAARLQGFPDTFRFSGPQNSMYRQVGNAVPALLAKKLFDHVFSGDDGFGGRIKLDVLREHPDGRLPFVLSPRYKPLFGKSSNAKAKNAEQTALADA